MRRTVTPAALCLLAALAAFPAPAGAAGEGRRPNVVVILADDLGYGELGCQGNPEVPTPHIDSLARNGIRCTDGHVSAPYCCPSRAGLLTGRYQTRFGHERNVVGARNLDPDVGLPLTEATMADVLKAAGYATGCVGKWHLGGAAKYHPLRRGFDEFYGFLHEGHFYAPPPYKGLTTRLRPNEPPYDEHNPVLRGTEPVAEPGYLTDAITREAVGFIERHKGGPFFLYVPYNAVHSPMQAPNEYLDRFSTVRESHRRLFAAMLAALDDGVGRILGKLRDLGLERDTIVIFLSDNGGPTAELTSSNRPLRGGKGTLWEGGVRVPFLIQWPGHLPAGTYTRPVIALDILPTVAAAAGAELPRGRDLDGVDLLPYLSGENKAAPHDVLFWRYGPNIALRQGDWKLVRQADGGEKRAEFQLFDLASDIGETTDLAAREPELTRRLRATLDALDAEMVDPLW